jgi:DEAD/DEAH box helicase domain-containing protein
MPYGKMMYQNIIKKAGAEALNPAKTGSFDLLMEYLQMPDAEMVFRAHAYAYALSLLDPKLMKNNLAFNGWKTITDAVKEQTHYTDADFVFPGTAYGSWIPRTNNAHLAVYAGILAAELKSEGAVAVCVVLKDEKDQRTDKYEQEWNGLWQFFNMMQFSDEFIAVSSIGMTQMAYLSLPIASTDIVLSADNGSQTVDAAWDAIAELLFDDDAKAFASQAKDAGIPVPGEDYIGYEVEGDDGEVIATIEIAWPDEKVGYMTIDQLDDKEMMESMGWHILDILSIADATQYFGGDK